MQSPGLPENITTPVLAGPYLIRTVGSLPKTSATISIRMSEENASAKMMGWDGSKWQSIQSTINGKTVTGTSALYDTFIVTQ